MMTIVHPADAACRLSRPLSDKPFNCGRCTVPRSVKLQPSSLFLNNIVPQGNGHKLLGRLRIGTPVLMMTQPRMPC